MTNSDSGNRPMTAAHQPGDRVRILAVGDRVKVAHRPELDRGISTPSGAFARRRNHAYDGNITAESCGLFEVNTGGSERAWFDPSELEPIVTDADGLPVGGADAPAADRPVPELRAAIAAIVDALEAKLTTANAEAQDARQEAREAKDAAAGLAASVDALRGKLGAAELKLADALEALATERAAHEETGRLADRWRKERDAALGGAAAKPAVEQRVAEIEARLGRLETMGTGMGTEPTARARVSGA